MVKLDFTNLKYSVARIGRKIRSCARYKELPHEDSDELVWELLESREVKRPRLDIVPEENISDVAEDLPRRVSWVDQDRSLDFLRPVGVPKSFINHAIRIPNFPEKFPKNF